MQQIEVTRENGRALATAMLDAMNARKLDEAGIWLDKLKQLNGLTEEHPDILKFRTLIAMQQGRMGEALARLNAMPANVVPDLRVLCMYCAEDPAWKEQATALADNSPDPEIRSTMALLLGRGDGAKAKAGAVH